MTNINAEWRRCRPWIVEALKVSDFYAIEDIEREIAEGTMTFWPGKDAAAVTEFITYPNGKALNVFAGGGNSAKAMQELIEVFEPCFDTWAKAADCRWIIGYGRPGWKKVCEKMGYSHLWTVMSKEVV